MDPIGTSANTMLNAWSDESSDRPPILDIARLPAAANLNDVFAVHEALAASPEAARRLGGVGGYKLGWKNHPLLDEFGMPAMYSPIFAGCFRSSGSSVSLSRHKIFAAEAEYAHVMARSLGPRAAPYTQQEVWAAVSHVEACIELCGTRTAVPSQDFLPLANFFLESVSPYQLLSDAMLNALTIRGPVVAMGGGSENGTDAPPSHLANATVKLLADGVEVSSGTGKENPCDSPIASLTFLVNDLTQRRGLTLEAGAIVIAGHTCQVLFPGRPSPSPARGLPRAFMSRVPTPMEPSTLPKSPEPLGVRTPLVAHFDVGGEAGTTVEVTLLE